MTYRKKPVTVEAFQYDGDFKNSDGKWYIPNWAIDAFKSGTMFFMCAGELYPCKPDIFAKTYELC